MTLTDIAKLLVLLIALSIVAVAWIQRLIKPLWLASMLASLVASITFTCGIWLYDGIADWPSAGSALILASIVAYSVAGLSCAFIRLYF